LVAGRSRTSSINAVPGGSGLTIERDRLVPGQEIQYDANLVGSASGLLGDVNNNVAVKFFDISPFITAMQSGDFLYVADINQDGAVNFFDISPFIDLLSAQYTCSPTSNSYATTGIWTGGSFDTGLLGARNRLPN